MLVNAKRLEYATINGSDGKVGKLRTFLFDDERWVVRYLVVKRGFWILGRDVLISPMSVNKALEEADFIDTNLDQETVKNAPSADLARPVSRRMEEQLHAYYRVPVYWGGAGLWGGAMTPIEAGVVTYNPDSAKEPQTVSEEENHLRSTKEIIGYSVESGDEKVGAVADALVEDSTWAIRYLRVDARSEYGDGILYISPDWISDISWIEEKLELDLDSDVLKKAPHVGRNRTLLREEEIQIHEQFQRPRYWA